MKLISYKETDFEKIYLMYKDLPSKEWDFVNKLSDATITNFKKIYDDFVAVEFDSNMPTKRFVLEDENKYIGYIAIRLSKDESWLRNGSQLFYQIRFSERGKGYCNNMIKLALNEMKRYGFKNARINCNNENIPSKKSIVYNGGIIDIKDYQSNTGISSSYIIKIK